MLDRYGAPGFLAAYNAGPARYDKHLADGRPLPVETQDYVAKLAPMIGAQQGDGRNVGTFDLFAWLHAALHDAAEPPLPGWAGPRSAVTPIGGGLEGEEGGNLPPFSQPQGCFRAAPQLRAGEGGGANLG